MTEVVKSADGTSLGKRSLWSRGQASVASTSATTGGLIMSQRMSSPENSYRGEAETPERSQSEVSSFTRPATHRRPILLRAFLHRNAHWRS